ncbi:MAG: FtsW/RodA/SpoVE family cell cycle protein [Rickettsiales bacterium]|nr:FtsW/RodA/SpoVE family cell cycle protein [Rickettsiales bacterium]
MIKFLSRNSYRVTKWWYSLDHTILFLVFCIMLFGLLVITSSSPSVAYKIGVDADFFYQKHLIFLLLGIFVMLIIPAFDEKLVLKLSLPCFAILLLLLCIVLLNEPQLKGAKRWIRVGGFSIQPSEFLKPVFLIINSLLLAKYIHYERSLKFIFSTLILYLTTIFLLVLQPDMGMVINFTLIWLSQLFLVGFSFSIILSIGLVGILGLVLAYYNFAHVKYRLDMFLFSDGNLSYQVQKSLDAIKNGGFFGTGYYHGEVKENLPDAHTDFVFAVIVEEFGFVISSLLILCYTIIIIRVLTKAYKDHNIFVSLLLSGLALQLAFQVIVNIGVSINLLPTKGTILPLVSYGGSSLIATSAMIGLILLYSKSSYGRILD